MYNEHILWNPKFDHKTVIKIATYNESYLLNIEADQFVFGESKMTLIMVEKSREDIILRLQSTTFLETAGFVHVSFNDSFITDLSSNAVVYNESSFRPLNEIFNDLTPPCILSVSADNITNFLDITFTESVKGIREKYMMVEFSWIIL